MTEQTNSLATRFSACWKGDALKERFLSDPKSVLAEHGLEPPEGITVKVVENSDNTVHITLPATPVDHIELTDAELSHAAGGNGRDAATNYDCDFGDSGANTC